MMIYKRLEYTDEHDYFTEFRNTVNSVTSQMLEHSLIFKHDMMVTA